MQKPLPVYNLVLVDDNTGIDLTSFVSEAAMMETFVALSAQPQAVQLATDKTKYELTAPLIVPERRIYRSNVQGQPAEVQFTVEETRRIGHQFMRTGKINLANTEHDDSQPVDAQLVELWIIADPKRDKAATLDFDLPAGTLMATYHVNDKQYWKEQVETGNVTGFSLQGNFRFERVQLSAESQLESLLDELLHDLA